MGILLDYLMRLMSVIAVVSLLVGLAECFAGFRLMKIMLALWGFLIGFGIGALIGALTGKSGLIFVLGLLFGFGVSFLSYWFYLVGIFLLTAGMTALVGVLVLQSWLVVPLALAFGALAVLFVKPVVIGVTSLSGASSAVYAAFLLPHLSRSDPYAFLQGFFDRGNAVLMIVCWLLLAMMGAAVQYVTTRSIPAIGLAYSAGRHAAAERKPVMQRVCRNFCIRCGSAMNGKTVCPNCGFKF